MSLLFALERIQKSCREYGLKKPMIEEFGNGFRVVLFRKTVNESQDMRKKFETIGIVVAHVVNVHGIDGAAGLLTGRSSERRKVVIILK